VFIVLVVSAIVYFSGDSLTEKWLDVVIIVAGAALFAIVVYSRWWKKRSDERVKKMRLNIANVIRRCRRRKRQQAIVN